MLSTIAAHREEIATICRCHHIDRLYLFGSATSTDFGPESDLDFIVTFDQKIIPADFADNFFALMDELQNLLQRKIDLLTERSVKNPVLKEEIERTKLMLFAA